ncbi:phospholipase A(1) [Shewanella sp. NFH-SH190041]|uniref:phospholipase A n=1 Tax=Shewanella sp. NFH-SH190041 TaxID=2950245 RepID=UPI0021C27037|nr:phospholipase A [Shewanella sp. NFH-SH190041]BDM65295.1 phospholipase A(1) [Shewanella sp. NFH-SH190041]
MPSFIPKTILLIILCGLSPLSYSKPQADFSPQTDQFTLTPYGDNYALPFFYTTDPNQEYFSPQNPNGNDINKANFQFQVSLKYGLASNVFTANDGIYFSYTQIANWQAYDRSAYFRDTQYQPELFWVFNQDIDASGWNWHYTRFGFMHQSNGKGGHFERSWNRFFLETQFGNDNVDITIRPWVRLQVKGHYDYNPNIEKYMGNGDIQFRWQPGRHILKLTLRNQIESGLSRGYEALSWQFPLYKKLHGYLKLESGYGFTISDYDFYDNAVGIGISL